MRGLLVVLAMVRLLLGSVGGKALDFCLLELSFEFWYTDPDLETEKKYCAAPLFGVKIIGKIKSVRTISRYYFIRRQILFSHK